MNPYDDLELEYRRYHPRREEYDEVPDPVWLLVLVWSGVLVVCVLTWTAVWTGVLMTIVAWWP